MLSNLSYASFPIGQKHASEHLRLDSQADQESIWTKLTAKPEQSDFHFGGLLLGFLLGLIGVGLAYLFSKNPAVKRSSWYGLGLWIVLFLALGGLSG